MLGGTKGRQISDRVLAGLILGWTAISWGGRIGLLTGSEGSDPWTWVRVGGSILVGLAAAHVLWWGAASGDSRDRSYRLMPPPFRRNVLLVFVMWTVVLWGRALALAWVDAPSVAFSLVHTALAVGWAVLAMLVGRMVYRPITERQ